MEPEVPPALDRRLGEAPVPAREGERLVGADDELARLSGRDLDVVLVDDLGLEARHRAPHPARALLAATGTNDEVRLRHPVAFDDLDAEAVAEDVPQRRRRRRGEGDADAVGAVEGAGLAGGQDRGHRTEDVGDGRAGVDERLPEARRGEPVPDREPGRMDERLDDGVQGVRVKEREAGEEHVALCDPERPAGVLAPPPELAVRTDDALRRPGGAGRVEDRQWVAGAGVADRRCRADRRDRRGGGAVDPERDRAVGQGVEVGELVRIRLVRDDESRPGVADDVLELGAPARRVDGNQHGPGPGTREQELDEQCAVRQQRDDTIAWTDTDGCQRACAAGRPLGRVRERPRLTARNEKRCIAQAGGAIPEERGHGAFRRGRKDGSTPFGHGEHRTSV